MSTLTMTMASPSSKRDFDTAHEPSTPDARNAASITADGNLEGHKDDTTYSTSEAMTKESLSCESTPLSSVAGVSPSPQRITMSPAAQPESSQQPAKKRKLTYAELEIQRIEKQFKEQQRAEEAARLLEEKRLKEEHKKEEKQRKEEEKRQKEEEKERNRLDREKKQKVKDEEKQRKEEERQRKEANKAAERKAKEEEKAKKERVWPTRYRNTSNTMLTLVVAIETELILHETKEYPSCRIAYI
jgi:flagellar biosynthesis GTPase FlhF